MPIYEFQCQACSHEFDLLVKSSDWKGSTCPGCGSSRLAKKLSVFAVAGEDACRAIPDAPPCSGNPSACQRCCG